MNLIGAEQKAAVERTVHSLRAAREPAECQISNKAVVTLVENQHSVAAVRGFTVLQDEPTSVAGSAKGPTPTDYFVVALGCCENVIFVRTAATHELPVASLQTTVVGSWDRRGLFELDQAEPGFTEILIETQVSTDAPKEAVAEVARLTHRRCPIYATLRRETRLVFKLLVNGEAVAL